MKPATTKFENWLKVPPQPFMIDEMQRDFFFFKFFFRSFIMAKSHTRQFIKVMKCQCMKCTLFWRKCTRNNSKCKFSFYWLHAHIHVHVRIQYIEYPIFTTLDDWMFNGQWSYTPVNLPGYILFHFVVIIVLMSMNANHHEQKLYWLLNK